jgi:hypothetical protein
MGEGFSINYFIEGDRKRSDEKKNKNKKRRRRGEGKKFV